MSIPSTYHVAQHFVPCGALHATPQALWPTYTIATAWPVIPVDTKVKHPINFIFM